MQWLANYKENQKTKRQLSLEEDAKKVVTLDYAVDNTSKKLYIWVHGIPVVEISDDCTPAHIIEKVEAVRNNYVRRELMEHAKLPCASLL